MLNSSKNPQLDSKVSVRLFQPYFLVDKYTFKGCGAFDVVQHLCRQAFRSWAAGHTGVKNRNNLPFLIRIPLKPGQVIVADGRFAKAELHQ